MGSISMKGTFRVCPGVLRYEFVYVKAVSFRGRVGHGRDEVNECGVYRLSRLSTRQAVISR